MGQGRPAVARETRPSDWPVRAPARKREYGYDNSAALRTPFPSGTVKLHQVDGVAHYLVAISPLQFRALKLDDEQGSVGEQHTIHPQPAPAKVELKKDVSNQLAAWRHQSVPQNWNPFVQMFLQDVNAS